MTVVAPTVRIQQLAYASVVTNGSRAFASETVAVGDRLAIIARAEDGAEVFTTATQTAGTATLAAPGWTRVQNTGTAGVNCRQAVFTAEVTGAGTMTVTVASTSSASYFSSMDLHIATGAASTNTFLAASARQLAITPGSIASYVATSTADWSAAASNADTYVPVGQGQTIDVSTTDGTVGSSSAGAHFSVFASHWPDTASAGATTYGLNAPSAGTYNTVAVEFTGSEDVTITYHDSSMAQTPSGTTKTSASFTPVANAKLYAWLWVQRAASGTTITAIDDVFTWTLIDSATVASGLNPAFRLWEADTGASPSPMTITFDFSGATDISYGIFSVAARGGYIPSIKQFVKSQNTSTNINSGSLAASAVSGNLCVWCVGANTDSDADNPTPSGWTSLYVGGNPAGLQYERTNVFYRSNFTGTSVSTTNPNNNEYGTILLEFQKTIPSVSVPILMEDGLGFILNESGLSLMTE